MSFFQHSQAIVESSSIGAGTKVWAFAHVLPNAVIGSDCNICDHVFIENDVIIGDRVTIKCGVQVWDGVTIEDDAFVGPNATFTNDPFPRSKEYPGKFSRTVIRKRASIGANATLLPGIVIGLNAMIGAGAVVTSDVPPNAIVMGNPARITGYVSAQGRIEDRVSVTLVTEDYSRNSLVHGVEVRTMPIVKDLRGTLSFGEYDRHLPFLPKRFFIVYDVPSKEVRGEHAHKKLQQFLVCIKGACSVVVDNGKVREEIILNSPSKGVYLPSMIWATQYRYSMDAVLLVFASDIYDPDDYIRNYDDYLSCQLAGSNA